MVESVKYLIAECIVSVCTRGGESEKLIGKTTIQKNEKEVWKKEEKTRVPTSETFYLEQ